MKILIIFLLKLFLPIVNTFNVSMTISAKKLMMMKFTVGPLSPPLKLSLMLMEWVLLNTFWVKTKWHFTWDRGSAPQLHRSGVRPESKLQLPGARSMKPLVQKMPPCSEKSLMGRREKMIFLLDPVTPRMMRRDIFTPGDEMSGPEVRPRRCKHRK